MDFGPHERSGHKKQIPYITFKIISLIGRLDLTILYYGYLYEHSELTESLRVGLELNIAWKGRKWA